MAVRRRAGSGDTAPERRGLLRRRRTKPAEEAVTPVIAAPAATGPRVTTWADDLAAARDAAPAPALVRSNPWLEAEQAEAERLQADQATAQEAEAVRLRDTVAPTAAPSSEERLAEELRAGEARLAEARRAETRAEQIRLDETRRAEARLAEESAEADRIEAEQRAAQTAEQARLSDETRRAEETRLAAEAGESARIDTEQREAQAAEQARLAASPPADLPDEVWLATEGAAAAGIERERAEAQAVEEARLETAGPRVEAARVAAERAEAERIDAERRSAQIAEEARIADAAITPPPIARGPVRPVPDVPADALPATPDRFVRFEPGTGLRYLLGVVFIVAAACAVLAVFWGVAEGSAQAFGLAAIATGLAAANWWALLRSAPNLVSIREGMLNISHGPDLESFDLREPSTPLVMTGDTRSRSWRATLRTPSGHVITLTARDVDPAQFAELVGSYRALGPHGKN